jgi:hypothetical protein
VVFLSRQNCSGQGLIGQNQVASFTRNQYVAGTQNWTITQDQNSRLYIANNEGLLVYNGTNWQLYPVPNKTILRSLGFGTAGKLYVGAQDELGFYAPDKVGRLRFTSLKNLLPEMFTHLALPGYPYTNIRIGFWHMTAMQDCWFTKITSGKHLFRKKCCRPISL